MTRVANTNAFMNAFLVQREKKKKISFPPGIHTFHDRASAQILFEVSMYLIRECVVWQISHHLCTFELQTIKCANLDV